MASEVIELGSSDDESEPTPKKIKPVPNAMVHIPNKLPGITIKPAKPKNNTCTNGVNRKTTTIGNMANIMINPCSIKMKNAGKIPSPLIKQVFKPPSRPTIIGYNTFLNPIHQRIPILQTKNAKSSINISRNIKTQAAGCLSNLPPTITVKRTKIVPKRVAPYTVNNVKKKQKLHKEVLTVDLVDDDLATSSGPQWYLRPEEQVESLKAEEQNNAEPDISKLVEITIDDSPVKPLKPNKTNEARMELSIIIDDSPVKTTMKKHVNPSGSDEENDEKKEAPHSKKKLEYPKSDKGGEYSDKIEIQLTQIENGTKVVEKSSFVEQSENVSYIVEIEESPVKQDKLINKSTPKKKCPVKPYLNNVEFEIATKTKEEVDEFHPVYQSFIDLCFELENSDDMKKIVEKKIKAYYRQVPKVYTESEDFIDMVSSKMLSMKAGPEKMYLYIKDIVDELNFKRKLIKSQAVTEEIKTTDTDKHIYGEDNEFDSKRQRQIRKLEKTLKKLHRAIQKLEEQEVDFDDEEDSVYLLTERYKERLVRVHAKFCQLTNTKMPSEPRVQIDARPGQPRGPAKHLEKFINKKVSIGKPLPFPDFHDVIRCVRNANDEDGLGWNEADIMDEARDLFTRCGKKLQRRRQENEWRLAASRISVDADPADNSEELKKKLHQNMQTAVKKEADVFNKYVDRQNLLKLEAEEIGDKEAEESLAESEEEEEANVEDTSLETAEKRKERLKRLLHEKCKKNAAEKISKPVELDDNQATCLDVDKDETTDLQNKKINKENEHVKDPTENHYKTHTKLNGRNDKVIDNEKTEVETAHSESIEHKSIYNSDNSMQLVSDDSNKIESDIDELHLLQKLHSENEMNTSTVDSSDTDTENVISDTLDSSGDNKKPPSDDVISIENSSYSESEMNLEKHDSIEKEAKHYISEPVPEPIDDNTETKSNESNTENVLNKSNNDEYNDSVENILLASSDEDEDSTNKDSIERDDVCVNLKDDSISIGDTIVEGHNNDMVTVDVLEEVIPEKIQEAVINTDENLVKADEQEPKDSRPSEVDTEYGVIKMNNEKQAVNTESC